MQPTFRQVPPNGPRSTMAMSQPSCSGPITEFPDPVPMIIRSKLRTASGTLAVRPTNQIPAEGVPADGARSGAVAQMADRIRVLPGSVELICYPMSTNMCIEYETYT